jgi:hypothetical protein
VADDVEFLMIRAHTQDQLLHDASDAVRPSAVVLAAELGVDLRRPSTPGDGIRQMWRGTAWNGRRDAERTDDVPTMWRGCSVYRRRF